MVTISSGGTKLNEAATPFASVSSFRAVPSGDLTIAVGNNTTISANRTLPLESGKIYTVLLVGDPAATDGSRKVEIRYIVNGTVAPTTGS